MKPCDLQVHTTASDGKLSPREVVELALKRKMKAIAITDHYTISGLDEAIDYSKGKNIEIVSGIEIGCREKDINSLVDIIGLFINYKNEKLLAFTEKIKSVRMEEKNNIIRQLSGRRIRSIAEKHNGKIIRKIKDMLIPRKNPSIKEAVDIIKSSGGISILAHPARYGNEMIKITDLFVSSGGKGIEVDYPYEKVLGIHNSINKKIREIAKDKRLLISGGSDFHYFNHGGMIGECGVSDEEFGKLKDSLK